MKVGEGPCCSPGRECSHTASDHPGLILQAQLTQALEELGGQKQRADMVSPEMVLSCHCVAKGRPQFTALILGLESYPCQGLSCRHASFPVFGNGVENGRVV